jgi:hypothetical protein
VDVGEHRDPHAPPPGSRLRMTPESLEGDLPPDAGEDAAEESRSGAMSPGSVAGGPGAGTPGEPPEPGREPGEGPTADEATGVTGEGEDGAA